MTRLEIRAARGVKDVVTAPVDQAKPSQPWAGAVSAAADVRAS